ncbi:kinesin [Paenibacillus sp. JX-17]|uniref:Kinesin n=1 Tax=Paenibacillus lacisoli TaxID=3064525 RepID=A0ABT9CDR3_9BACL|nr:kinesin [Paenibacillus sp. JX-17]MDO7905831.1 kinesin [Paenibacillus sp. JX-17]
MANKDLDIEKESSGGIERFLFFLIPIVFTVVLVGVLLTMFNIDFRNTMLNVAREVPVVKNWVPESKDDPKKSEIETAKDQAKSAEATIKELKSQVAKQDQQIQQAQTDKSEQQSKVEELEKQVQDLQAAADTSAAQTQQDAYTKQIKDLAKMYSTMSAGKAAPILQNMTTEEIVQLLSQMNQESRAAILAKMDPKTAADITVALQNAKPSSDLAIAALQSRLNQTQSSGTAAKPTTNSKNLDKSQISQMFSTMTPKSGADLILKTFSISPDKAITILNSVDDATRSKLLESMSSQDAALSAKILNKLMGGK